MLSHVSIESLSWTASANTSSLARAAITLKKRHNGLAKLLVRNAAFLVLSVFVYGLLDSAAVQAGPITDPANDFRVFDPGNPSSFAGPKNPGLDVLSANVVLNLNLQTLTFTSTMAGPISGLIDPTSGHSWVRFPGESITVTAAATSRISVFQTSCSMLC